MTLDDLKRQNNDFYARYILRANCAEIKRYRHGQATYEIFSIERRFRPSNLDFLGLRKNAHEAIKERYSSVKVFILPLLASMS